MSILIFFGVLFVLILVHEWGHFIVAKKTGMRVDEFGIGFPPKLFGIKKGETEYTFNAFPIGGFVRIQGENFGEDDESQSVDNSRSFGSRPKWAQALVLIAGVTMNVLFAWFLFVLTFMIGIPTPVEEGAATENAQLYVQEVIAGGPAVDMLSPGAEIIAVTAGDMILSELTPSALTNFVTAVAPEIITVTYKAGDDTVKAEITPAAGLIVEDPERFLIGIRPVLVEDVSYGFFESVKQGTSQTMNGLVMITDGLFSLIKQSVMGTADYSQVAGPIGIVNMVGDAAAFGVVALLSFTAFISLNLAVINLLPLPALDGGRLIFVAFETLTGKQIPPKLAGRMNLIGISLLLLLMLAVTYNDIIRLIS